MALSVAPLYAAFLGFLLVYLVYLSFRVIRLRRRLNVAIGAGGHAAIERAARLGVVRTSVNETARIESLSKTLNWPILISSAFRESVPDPMISLGRPILRGVTGEREIIGLPAADAKGC